MKRLLKNLFSIKIKKVRDPETHKLETAEYYTILGIVYKVKYKPLNQAL